MIGKPIQFVLIHYCVYIISILLKQSFSLINDLEWLILPCIKVISIISMLMQIMGLIAFVQINIIQVGSCMNQLLVIEPIMNCSSMAYATTRAFLSSLALIKSVMIVTTAITMTIDSFAIIAIILINSSTIGFVMIIFIKFYIWILWFFND